MLELGKYNNLRIVKEVDFGLYLDGGEAGEILLPKRYIPRIYEIDQFIDVFIYRDSEDRLIATTEKAMAQVGDFALLRVKEVNNFGAFLSWGLMKDLLVPFSEQKLKMEVGRSYFVKIYIDEKTDRIVASAKINKFLDKTPCDILEGEEVDLIICNQTDLGFNAIINEKFTGVIYENEIFTELQRGMRIKGYIKKIRTDNKIDLSLQKIGFVRVDELGEKIVTKLKKSGGFLPLNDKTDADKISSIFGVSKKTFKKSIGNLYKNRIITIKENGIELNQEVD